MNKLFTIAAIVSLSQLCFAGDSLTVKAVNKLTVARAATRTGATVSTA